MKEYIDSLKLSGEKRFGKTYGFIATGGNIEDIYSIASGMQPPSAKPISMDNGTLRDIIHHLCKTSYTERIEKFKLRPDRVDVILPAAMVYEKLAHMAGAKKIIIPLVGTKEGILFDLIEKTIAKSQYSKATEEELMDAAIRLGHHYRFDKNHALHVAKIAVSLFDQFSKIHKLDENDRNILLVSAILHDIGLYISYKKHHRHSSYLIAQSELPRLTETEILMAANVARYHRKSEPSVKHEFYGILPETLRRRVSAMASILRIADSLDRDKMQSIKTVRAEIAESHIMLFPDVGGSINLDLWAFEKKKKMFVNLFKMDVKIDRSSI